MNDAPEGAGPSLGDIAARLEELTREVRRQGRAAVAAQAAAESCLERLGEASERDEEEEDANAGDAAVAANEEAWLRALLPVADALDRMVTQANSMLQRPPPPPPPPPPHRALLGWFSAPPPPPPPPPGHAADLAALADGLRVLRAQLGEALGRFDVVIDRRTGVAIDPEVHRICETRPLRAGEQADLVLEVVRPGYAIGGKVVREAEIVAGRPREGSG